MASVRTTAAGGGTSSTGDRTVTITPADGDLLVVFVVVAANTQSAPTMTDDNGSGTYTLVATALKNSSADIMSVFVRDKILTNATSTVITAVTGSNTAGELVVVAVQGMAKAGAAAILQSKALANQAAGGTPAPAFTSSALTGNVTLGAVGNGTNPATLTAPTNWTEQQDVGQASPTTGLEVVTRDSGFTGTTITWGSTSASAFAALIVELDTTGLSLTPTVGAIAGAGVAGLNNQALRPVVGEAFFGLVAVPDTPRTPAVDIGVQRFAATS